MDEITAKVIQMHSHRRANVVAIFDWMHVIGERLDHAQLSARAEELRARALGSSKLGKGAMAPGLAEVEGA